MFFNELCSFCIAENRGNSKQKHRSSHLLPIFCRLFCSRRKCGDLILIRLPRNRNLSQFDPPPPKKTPTHIHTKKNKTQELKYACYIIGEKNKEYKN